MKNKVIIHACGGCGFRVTNKVLHMLSELGDGFADVEFKYVDTSLVNFNKITPKGDLFEITTKNFGKEKPTGSGGERSTHDKDTILSVKEYLDKNKYITPVNGVFHIVISSVSGGSGSLIANVLTSCLLERDIPTIVVGIGDRSSELYSKTTLRTLTSYDGVARNYNKALCMMYVNNSDVGNNSVESEKEIDTLLYKSLSAITLFLSGENESIDNQDMVMMLEQTKYKSVTVHPGLYALMVCSKEAKPVEGGYFTGARSLGGVNSVCDINQPLQHFKKGVITSEDALSLYDNALPLHLVSVGNFLDREVNELNKAIKTFEQLSQGNKPSVFQADEGATDLGNGIFV